MRVGIETEDLAFLLGVVDGLMAKGDWTEQENAYLASARAELDKAMKLEELVKEANALGYRLVHKDFD